jgi:hypothetical protein
MKNLQLVHIFQKCDVCISHLGLLSRLLLGVLLRCLSVLPMPTNVNDTQSNDKTEKDLVARFLRVQFLFSGEDTKFEC